MKTLKPVPSQKPDLPETKHQAFTLERVQGGWRLVTLDYVRRGQEVELVDQKASEPDLKSIAIEKFKLAAFTYWSKSDHHG